MLVRDKLRNGGAKIFESYAITLNNDIWSRAGHSIDKNNLAAELQAGGTANPLFLNKDFERTEWYSNEKKAADVNCFTVVKIDTSIKLCNITNPADI